MDIVLVGFFEPKDYIEREMIHERTNLMEKLQSEKVPCLAVNSMWPRDEFVFYKGKLHTRKEHGHYADGGYVRTYPDFSIACEGVNEDEETGRIDSTDDRTKKLTQLYGEHVQIIPHLNYSLNEELRPHSDMVVFPVPDKKLVFIDALYLKENKRLLELFASKYDFQIKPVSNNYANPSWPCNTLSIKDGLETISITNSVSNGVFLDQLRHLDHRVISVPFMNNCRKGGSVNCATNTIPSGRVGDLSKIYPK